MKTKKVIQIEHLSYDYPDGTPALRDIHLEVCRHESVAILGPNGAGKSTLLYHLNGTLMGEGEMVILGIPVEKNNVKEIRRRVGLVFQSPEDQLFCPTVFDDVAFGPLNMGLDEREVQHRVEKALETMGLKGFEGRSAHHLSEGEKKRVALATVLSMDSEILALDEPTDPIHPSNKNYRHPSSARSSRSLRESGFAPWRKNFRGSFDERAAQESKPIRKIWI
jgi:cobalt/nickel transport system ATP-binding protein